MAAVIMLNSVDYFGKKEVVLDDNKVNQLVEENNKLREKIKCLQRSLLTERSDNESLKSDLEHALHQLNLLKENKSLIKQVDVKYI